MIPSVKTVASNIAGWIREAATSINLLIGQVQAVQGAQAAVTFAPQSAAPTAPIEGMTYYDGPAHKLRTWNGSAWIDLS